MLTFFVEAIYKRVKLLNKMMFSCFQNEGIFVLDLLNDNTFNIWDCMSICGEMFARGLRNNVSFNVVSMLTKSFLKCLCSFSDVRVFRMIFSVNFRTSPSVYDIFGLAINFIFDNMLETIKVTDNFRSGGRNQRTNWAHFW